MLVTALVTPRYFTTLVGKIAVDLRWGCEDIGFGDDIDIGFGDDIGFVEGL